MRRLLFSWLTGILLSLACGVSADSQEKMPDPAAKAVETKGGGGGSTPIAVYTLAAIGTIIVMVLVCMPARRE